MTVDEMMAAIFLEQLRAQPWVLTGDQPVGQGRVRSVEELVERAHELAEMFHMEHRRLRSEAKAARISRAEAGL